MARALKITDAGFNKLAGKLVRVASSSCYHFNKVFWVKSSDTRTATIFKKDGMEETTLRYLIDDLDLVEFGDYLE